MRCALGTWDGWICCNGEGHQRVDLPLTPPEGRKLVEGHPPQPPHPSDFSLAYSLWAAAKWGDLPQPTWRCSSTKWPVTSDGLQTSFLSLSVGGNGLSTCFFQNTKAPDRRQWPLTEGDRSNKYVQKRWIKRSWLCRQHITCRNWLLPPDFRCFLDVWVCSEAKCKDNSVHKGQ